MSVPPSLPRVRFATRNPGKLREVRQILGGMGIRVALLPRSFVEPQADDLRSVVEAKLATVHRVRAPVLVEDSGLFIPSLGGFPGVYSAYISQIWGERVGFRPLLRALDGLPRGAVFRTVAGLSVEGEHHFFVGESRGSIAASPRGSGGFGYDPIFVPRGERRSFAEMSAPEKNRYSHRGRALRKAGRHLRAMGSIGRR